MDIQPIIEQLQTLILTQGLSLLGAVAIFLIGRWLARVIADLIHRALDRTDTDKSLIGFVRRLIYYAVIAFAAIAALGLIGVETASLVALVGAAGLAVGLSLQGALENFAAGVLILFNRPFKSGDWVEIAGVEGTVDEVQLFSTILITRDNKTVIVPNGQITGESITNFTRLGVLRMDLTFRTGYEDDLLKAKHILEEILAADERVLKDPPPTVFVLELADFSVDFACRPFVTVEDYWALFADLHERVKLAFDAAGLSIPIREPD